MKISKIKLKSGYMLPAAMTMVAVMVLITSSLLSNSDFALQSEYKENNRVRANTLARTGLENITFLLRNLASQSENMDTLCAYLPRVAGVGNCDSTANTMQPAVASFATDPFSDWIQLNQSTDFDNLILVTAEVVHQVLFELGSYPVRYIVKVETLVVKHDAPPHTE